MKRLDFTFDEVLFAIRELEKAEGAGFTVAQMSAQTGYNANWCRAKVRGLIESGHVRYGGKKSGTTIDGKACKIPFYVMVIPDGTSD